MTEISKGKLQLLSSLRNKKMRERNSLFVAEGFKCVSDMVPAFNTHCIVAEKGFDITGILPSDFPADKIYTASPESMKKMSSLSSPAKVLAAFELPEPDTDINPLNSDSLYLMLDGIQDPGNLGTIIRTADWFGFDTIYASHDTADVFNPKTIQSAMGSIARVRIIYTDLKKLIEKSDAINVYGLLLDGKNMFNEKLERSGVIIMGNEGNGLSEEIRKIVTNSLLIPAYGTREHAESLNVAIATAITLARFRNL